MLRTFSLISLHSKDLDLHVLLMSKHFHPCFRNEGALLIHLSPFMNLFPGDFREKKIQILPCRLNSCVVVVTRSSSLEDESRWAPVDAALKMLTAGHSLRDPLRP